MVVFHLFSPCVAPSLRAQAINDTASPRAAVDAFLRAIDAEKWADAAMMLDLPVFERYLRQRVNAARVNLPFRDSTTAEELMAQDSTLPRAVAEWQAKQSNHFSSLVPFDDFSREFAGVTSFRALRTLNAAEAAARWLEAEDPMYQLRKSGEALNCALPLADSLAIYLRRPRQTIGSATVDDTTAYVLLTDKVTRAGHDPFYEPRPSTLLVRRRGGKWLIVPTPMMLRGPDSVVGMSCVQRRK
jgi:hypothetical protein